MFLAHDQRRWVINCDFRYKCILYNSVCALNAIENEYFFVTLAVTVQKTKSYYKK